MSIIKDDIDKKIDILTEWKKELEHDFNEFHISSMKIRLVTIPSVHDWFSRDGKSNEEIDANILKEIEANPLDTMSEYNFWEDHEIDDCNAKIKNSVAWKIEELIQEIISMEIR